MLNNIALLIEPKNISLQTINIPKIKENDILVKTAYCGICGTDIHIFDGNVPFVKYPIVPGHEFSGEIIKVGSRTKNDLKIGDRVAIDPNLSCKDFEKNSCYYCSKDRKNFCLNWDAIGVTLNGAFSEYVICPSTVAYKIPENISLRAAAFMEPLACCLHGLKKVDLTIDDVVLILGCGPIGLLMISIIKATLRCKIIASEPLELRRKTAKNLGADIIINPEEVSTRDVVLSETSEKGVDVAIECVGSAYTAQEAITSLNRGGRALIFGVANPMSKIELDIHKLYQNEISVFGSFTNPYENKDALELLAKKELSLGSIVSHEFSLDELERAIQTIKTNSGDVNKVMIKP